MLIFKTFCEHYRAPWHPLSFHTLTYNTDNDLDLDDRAYTVHLNAPWIPGLVFVKVLHRLHPETACLSVTSKHGRYICHVNSLVQTSTCIWQWADFHQYDPGDNDNQLSIFCWITPHSVSPKSSAVVLGHHNLQKKSTDDQLQPLDLRKVIYFILMLPSLILHLFILSDVAQNCFGKLGRTLSYHCLKS